MTNKNGVPKFRRETAAARRGALIEATLRSLEQYGHEGTSIRRISATAGVSIGLINHHFRSKAELIAAAYESLATALQKSLRRRARDKAGAPRERLAGFFRASFAPQILDPAVFKVWLVFWSMVLYSPEMRAVHDRSYRGYRSMLESLLGSLAQSGDAPRFKLRPAAIALGALLDGLWFELSLSPAIFNAAEAVAICEDWIAALCSGALPSLLVQPLNARARRKNTRESRE